MNRYGFFFITIGFLFSHFLSPAQNIIEDDSITYETFYDDPQHINKLYIHIQPVYGELFMTNVNMGYGFEVDYFLKDKFDFNASFRKAYGQKSDFVRDVAEKNSEVLNDPKKFYFAELGLAYHIIDREEASKAKFILYSKTFQYGNKWESTIPRHIEAPAQLRRIYGVRLGAASYQSTVDVNRIIVDQENIPRDAFNGLSAYSNIMNHGFYIGGLLKLIKNVTINFDQIYQQITNDLIFTTYLDLLVFPFTTVEDIQYIPPSGSQEQVFPGDNINTTTIGMRTGINGKFNRDFSFGYNVELGYRPGIQGQNFYILGKVSFPLIGFMLEKPGEEISR
ncbi:MAG: hypothetical protein KFF73_05735 [Cyclobacteriaceae bacterium]|nr:hypothetical protein [Cyclobacteriaceae bacterium]